MKGVGRVAVLMGGKSEREVSIESGQLVLASLQRQGIDAIGIDYSTDIISQLHAAKATHVFNMLHGGEGENGVVQSLLHSLGLPYTDSPIQASACAMDKVISKLTWLKKEIPVPRYKVIDNATKFADLQIEFGLPFVVKPTAGGSTLGISIVRDESQYKAALEYALEISAHAFVEEYIGGKELTVGVLADQPLPVVQIVAASGFYNFEAKYKSDSTTFLCPSGLDATVEKEVQAVAMKAYHALGCENWGTVDLIYDTNGQIKVLEVNTIPAMTVRSVLPIAAKQIDLSFDELTLKILLQSLPKSTAADAEQVLTSEIVE